MKFFYALPALVLAVSACSAPAPLVGGPGSEGANPTTAPPSLPPSSVAMQPALYRLTTRSGAEISFTLPTPATDPDVAGIEAYRVKIGAAPVSYLVADVDNRKGTMPVNLYMVSAFDEEGRQLTFTRVADVIQSWGPTYSYDFKWLMGDGRPVDEAVGAGLRSEATDLMNSTSTDADVAGQARIVLASVDAALPAEVTRVTVQPFGMGAEEQAQPAKGK